ncbi:MAG: glycosyl transferase, family 2, partial [Rhodospirillales bacterium]|nr:glycosyl transferase, family 2 [Rhodospirillales bacterium]
LLLNNDIEMVERGWLREMAGLAAQDDVGAVGAKLLYPDRTVQHAGVLIGRGGVAGHMFHRLPGDAPGAGERAIHAQDLSAVTAACLLTRTAVWRSLNGLEEGLAVAFNDTDYCLRVRQAGLRVVWTPHATLIHHESVSRGADEKPENRERLAREARFMMDRWGNILKDDPFFSPNLDMETAEGALAFPPRVPRPWEEG